MTDNDGPLGESSGDATGELPGDPTGSQLAALARLLGDAAAWEKAPSVEDAIVAEIAGEIAARRAAPVPIETARVRRAGGRDVPWWMAAAAAAVALLIGVVVTRVSDGSGGDQRAADATITLAATDLAPGATATAALSSTPAGLKILLDTEGLPGADDGAMYEAWISDGTIRVSAGTFHLRGGDAPIELWAGTVDPSFTTLAVTREPLDGEANSSGEVVLRGEFDLGEG